MTLQRQEWFALPCGHCQRGITFLYQTIILFYGTGVRPGEVELLRMTLLEVDLISGSIEIGSADKKGLKQQTVSIIDINDLRHSLASKLSTRELSLNTFQTCSAFIRKAKQ